MALKYRFRLKDIKIEDFKVYLLALFKVIFYSLSYLNVFYNYKETTKAKEIYIEILGNEFKNGMPEEVILNGKKTFDERLQKIDWQTYYKSWPFNESALALYAWAPVADELKALDKKIVLNSMILKWENIQKEFEKLINV